MREICVGSIREDPREKISGRALPDTKLKPNFREQDLSPVNPDPRHTFILRRI